MQNFTNEDLLLYIYNELKGSGREVFEKELSTNWALKEKVRVFSEAINGLNQGCLHSPRKQSINALLQYAQGVSEVIPG